MIKAKDTSIRVYKSSVSTPEEVAKMSGIQKFLFNQSFDTDISEAFEEPVEIIEEEEPEEILPTFSEEDLRIARDEAFAKGKEHGINEKAKTIELNIIATLEKLDGNFDSLFKLQRKTATSNLNDAMLLAGTISRKIFPTLNERGALEEVESMIVEAMKKVLEEPKVSICIHPDIEPALKKHIEPLMKKANYKAEIQIISNKDIPLGDCSVEWESGGAYRNTESLLQEIDEIVESNLQEAHEIINSNYEDTEIEITTSKVTDPEQQGN